MELLQARHPGKQTRLELRAVQEVAGEVQLLQLWLAGEELGVEGCEGVVGEGQPGQPAPAEYLWRQVRQSVVGEVQL